jgi:tetratricopeptide (TPR) repeat protein
MRGILALVCLLLAGMANAISGVLIIQEKVPQDRLGDPNVAIANTMAEQLERAGVFAPVVWSYTDPIFRAATTDGLIKNPPEVPSIEQAQDAAKKLKVEYIIFVRAYQFGNSVMGRLQLFKGGKLIWKDPVKGTELIDPSQKPTPIDGVDKNGKPTKIYPKPETIKTDDRPMSVMGPDGLDLEDSALSLARTWTEYIKAGPMKGQAVQPKIQTPDPLPGTRTEVPVEAIIPKVKPAVDNKQLLADLDAMVRSGQSTSAILMLRDAVDAEPLDVERRIALVRTLLLVGQPELAAKEARRAAELLPERVELRAMAARAWIQAGREDEAMGDLNEAVARDPNSVETRMLLGEVNLMKLRPQQALENLDAVLKEKPSAEAWFKHALCQALMGKKDEALADLTKAQQLGLGAGSQEVAIRYDMTLDVLDRRITQLGDDLRSLFSEAQVHRTDPDVKKRFEESGAIVLAWSGLISASATPNIHRSSHDRRLLALNLLTQCLSDLGGYLVTNDEGTYADARINLGEALKQFAAAQTAYRSEIGGTAKGVGN